MSTNAKNVSTGKPKIGGSVFRAPIGTELPTSATTTLPAEYKDMGYISDEGITNNNTRESEDTKAWGGDTVMSAQTSKTDTFGLKFIETKNENVLKAVYGDENVTGDIETGMTIRANAKELDYGVWVIDMTLTDGDLKRVVIPNGKVTEIAEITYNDTEAVGYDTTITAFPGEDGDTHKEYIQKPTAPSNEG